MKTPKRSLSVSSSIKRKMSSSSGHASPTTSSPSSSIDSGIQNILTLEQTLVKFNSFKKNNTTKTNILRLVLLPYLRAKMEKWPSSTATYLKHHHHHHHNGNSPEMEKYLIYSTSVFLNWWKSLLSCAYDLQSISSMDKNCYLECISRIVSRYEWIYIESNENLNSFREASIQYKQLLLQTFEFAISRLLSLKNISLSLNAFIGKMFAYAFFKLPNISNGLLFLLNTKVKNFENVYNLSILNKNPTDSINPMLKTDLIQNFTKLLLELNDKFPSHLSNLINSPSQPRQTKFKVEKNFLNSLKPPPQKIEGIKETTGLWCLRWASLENVDLFCSFLRHYLILSSYYMKSVPKVMADDNTFGLPGFMYILTHIYEILDFQINSKLRQQATSSASPPPLPLENQSDKILRVLRDFIINPRHDYEHLLKNGVVKSIETNIRLLVFKTPLFNTSMMDQVFDLWLNFIKGQREILTKKYEDDNLDWEFWLQVIMKLLDSKSINCELRAFSMLYQIWDILPTNKYLESAWCKSLGENMKFNLTMYLINEQNWNQYFYHYLPLVRSFYIRLLVWRVLGLNSINLKSMSFRESINNKKISSIIEKNLSKAYSLTNEIHFTQLGPIANKKFIINPISNSKQSVSSKETIRTHPYEILDDAVYLCSNLSVTPESTPSLPSTPNGSTSKLSSKLTTSWVGKLLKKKSTSTTSESTPNLPSKNNFSSSNAEQQRMRSVSSYSSLLQTPPRIFTGNSATTTTTTASSSTSSTKSSSPSLFSSITSFSSPQSSFASFEFNDSIAATSHATQPKFLPPELNMKPPELERYSYKFQLTDNETKMISNYRHLQELQGANKFMKTGFLTQNIFPRLPSIKPLSDDVDLLDASLSDEEDNSKFIGGLGYDNFNGLHIDFGSFTDPATINSTVLSNNSDDSTYFSAPATPTTKKQRQLPEEPENPVFRNKELVAQSICEYNLVVKEFESFIISRMDEIHGISPCLSTGHGNTDEETNYDGSNIDTLTLNTLTSSIDIDLLKSFPLLVPEAPEKLNGN